MTIRDKISGMLENCGMFPTMAEKVMDFVVEKYEWGFEGISWDTQCDYPKVIPYIILGSIKPLVLEYLREHHPKAWFLPMFLPDVEREAFMQTPTNYPLPDKGLGYTIPKEMGWGKMIEIMERHGAIPGDWQHFMQDCDTEIAGHFVPEVCECPHCGSRELETGRFDPEGMVNKVECLSCKSEWLDVYKYVGIDLNP